MVFTWKNRTTNPRGGDPIGQDKRKGKTKVLGLECVHKRCVGLTPRPCIYTRSFLGDQARVGRPF